MGKYYLMRFLLFLFLTYLLMEWFIVTVSEPYLPYCDDPEGRER